MSNQAGKGAVKAIVSIGVIILALVFIIRGCSGGTGVSSNERKPPSGEVAAEYYSPVNGEKVTLFYLERQDGKWRYRLPDSEEWLATMPETFKDPASGRVLPYTAFRPVTGAGGGQGI